VELRPHDAGTPARRILFLAAPGGLSPPFHDLAVGGHGREHFRIRQRRFRVHVAPPEASFDAPADDEAAMAPEHVPDAGVVALYLVAGGGDAAILRQLPIEVCEQRPIAAELLQAASRLAQPLVLVLASSVDDGALLEEPVPSGAPVGEGCKPFRRAAGVSDVQERLGDAVELDAGLELRPARSASLDLAERMERAPLHTGSGPLGATCGFYGAASVAHEDVGRGYPRHQISPVLRVLAPREMAADDVLVGAGDEQHAAPSHPESVHVDDVVDFVARRQDRPQLPEPRRPPSERPRGSGEVALPVAGQQPTDERLELAGLRVVSDRGGRAAFPAAPSLTPRGRGPVALHIAPARRACHLLHPAIAAWEV